MKDYEKRWQPNSRQSVIAMLMGLDELRPQRPIHEKRRVLSESYTCKVESIALRPGSLVSSRRSCNRNNEILHGVKGVSGVQSSKCKNENVFDKYVNSSTSNVRKCIRSSKPAGASVSKSLPGNSCEGRRSFTKRGEQYARRHVLRYQQKLEHDSLAGHIGELGINFENNSSKCKVEMIAKPRPLSISISGSKSKSEKVAYDLEDEKLDIHSRPGYGEHGKSLMPDSGKIHHEFTCKEAAVNGIVSSGHRCIACTRNMNRISPPERCRSKFEEALKPGYKDYRHDPNLLLGQSSLANKSRKQNFQKWKTTKEVQEFGVSARSKNLNGILALTDEDLMARNLDMGLGGNDLCSPSSLQSRRSDSSSSTIFSSTNVADDVCLKSLPVSEFEAMNKILSSGWNKKQDESTARDNKSKVQAASQKDILESKTERDIEKFQNYLGVDNTISPSSKVSELSNCDSSCFGTSFNNPEAYIHGIQDEIDNCFGNDMYNEIEPSETNSKSSISKLAAQYLNDAPYASEEAFNVRDCSRIIGDPQSESYPGILSEEGGHSSHVEELCSREASLNEFSEEESAHSVWSEIGPPESLELLKRANQHSPDSVLERHDINNPPPFECFDSIGLQLQLQALNFSEESDLEGHVMVVSGDEDLEEQLGDVSPDGRKVKRWLGDDESRNFSYVVDVLDEAALCDLNSFMDFNTWASLECPISPLVFDMLEKKYGGQTSWQKSERQLLFDRINSGLMEIFNPVINFHACGTSIRRRFSPSFRRDEVEDELWMMLISQENDKSKDLSEKALDKWLEFEEGINIICGELETSLFDDLVMELATFWN